MSTDSFDSSDGRTHFEGDGCPGGHRIPVIDGIEQARQVIEVLCANGETLSAALIEAKMALAAERTKYSDCLLRAEAAERERDAVKRKAAEHAATLFNLATDVLHVPVNQAIIEAVREVVAKLDASERAASAMRNAGELLLESLEEYVRQSMHSNPEWRAGIVAIEAALKSDAGRAYVPVALLRMLFDAHRKDLSLSDEDAERVIAALQSGEGA